MTLEAKAESRIYVVEEEGGARYLFVELLIDCPLCGQQRLQVAGHHLKMIRDIALQAIDDYPDLTRSTVTQRDTVKFRGRSNDPSTS